MNVTVSIFNLATGVFTGGVYTGPERGVAVNTPEGCGAFDGLVDPLSKRVDVETGALVDYVPPPPPLGEVKAAARRRVDSEREGRLTSPVSYAGAVFDADGPAQRNVSGWLAVLNGGGSLPPGFVWRDFDNVDHPADTAWVVGLGAAMTARGTAVYVQSWEAKAAIDAATDEAGVLAALAAWAGST
jgi:hypothetical protein